MSRLRPAPGQRARLVLRVAVALALIALAALALSGAVDPLQSGTLTMLPAALLAALMIARPYVGERAIARLRSRNRPGRSAAVSLLGARRREVPAARGGRLIAKALAGRAPPLALAGARR